jgi:hypothetical protein
MGNEHLCSPLADIAYPECCALNRRVKDAATTYTSVLHATAYSLYTAPNPVQGLVGVQAIAAGAYHACALGADGGVTCWGDDGDGELGDGAARAAAPVAPALQCAQAR